MAGDPLGRGESNHPSDGNAHLTTINTSGSKVITPLWINQFSTGLNVQTDSAQLRDRLSHRPVRFAERYLQFTTIWNVANRDKYTALGSTLKNHWVYNFNQADQCDPMVLHYYGANKSWKGFIENWDTAFAITDVVLSYTFRMRLMNAETKTNEMSALTGKGPFLPKTEGYAPTAYESANWGEGWYALSDWPAQVQKQITQFEENSKKVVKIQLDSGASVDMPYYPTGPATSDAVDDTETK